METLSLVCTYLGRPCSPTRKHVMMMIVIVHGLRKAACYSYIDFVYLEVVRLALICCIKNFAENLSNAAHVVGDTHSMGVFDAPSCCQRLCLDLQGHANRYKRHIVPMMSLSVDFYVRVFVRIYTSPAAVKDAGSKLMYVYQSQGCDSFYTQKVGRKVSPQHFAFEQLKPHLFQQHYLHGLSLPALPIIVCMQIMLSL